MDTNQSIQQAVMMVKQGNREGALQIINRILETDPLNEKALLGYAYAVPDRQAGIQALYKVLEINPNNQAARRQLDLWMPQPAPGSFNPAPAPEQFNPVQPSNFVYTPIPDPAPAPERFNPVQTPGSFNPAQTPERFNPVPAPSQPAEPLPSWLTPTLAAEEAAPETGSAFGVYTGYQGSDPDPEPVPSPMSQNSQDDVYAAEKPEVESGDPTIRLLQAMVGKQESALEEQKKSFKYLVEYNNNLANVLNGYSRQMTDLRRQLANLFTSVLVLAGLVLVAVIVLLVK